MDIASISFSDETFDVVSCSQVLEHVQSLEKCIEELKRVLKLGGTLIISFPNERMLTGARFLMRRHPAKVPDHLRSLTPREVVEIVGLPVVSLRSLPFRLPFQVSYASLIVFQKK